MATHNVTLKAPDIEVVNKDFVFHLKRDGKKLGRLKISKGAIVFVPAYGGVRKQWKLTWDQVAEWAESEGKKVKG